MEPKPKQTKQVMKQGPANVSSEEPDSNYFRLFRPQSLRLLRYCLRNTTVWPRLCFTKNVLFVDAEI